MTLLEGSELRQVELNSDDQFPNLVGPQTNDAPAASAKDANSADDTELVPATEAAQPDDASESPGK